MASCSMEKMEDKGAVSEYLSKEYKPFKDNARVF